MENSKMNGCFIDTLLESSLADNVNDDIKDCTYIKPRAGLEKINKIAYLGGSISSSSKTPWHLNLSSTLNNLKIIVEEERNFSIGGVGAFFSVFNLNDVVQYNPDVVFIDFTVNEICSKKYLILETFGRIISLLVYNNINCCIIHNYHISFQKYFDQCKIPNTILILENLCDVLNIPSINFAQYFGDLLRIKKIKNEDFLGDSCHLNERAFELISNIYKTGSLENLWKNSKKTQLFIDQFKGLSIKKHLPLLTKAILPSKEIESNLDIRVVSLIKKFLETQKNVNDSVYIWKEDEEIIINFYGRWLFVHDIMGPTNGKVEIQVNDSSLNTTISRFDSYCSEHFRHHFFAIDCREIKDHEVKFKLIKEENKEEILSKRNKTILHLEDLNKTINYILRICSM